MNRTLRTDGISRPALLALHAAVCTCLSLLAACATAQVVPLTRVHAHNDYEHKRPLIDALDHGFCSVEADIYLVDGKLLVAHERNDVRPERTLQTLYLDPLRQRVRANGGRVYPAGPELTLLIDLKSDWHVIYPALRSVLEEYRDILVSYTNGVKHTNAVLAVITGDRSRAMLDDELVRYAALDGGLEDLDLNRNADLIPWISGNWSRTFHWRGTGTIPEDESARLDGIVARAHQQQRMVRFWGAPDNPPFWKVLLAHHVDLINTDDLDGAQKFLLQSGLGLSR